MCDHGERCRAAAHPTEDSSDVATHWFSLPLPILSKKVTDWPYGAQEIAEQLGLWGKNTQVPDNEFSLLISLDSRLSEWLKPHCHDGFSWHKVISSMLRRQIPEAMAYSQVQFSLCHEDSGRRLYGDAALLVLVPAGTIGGASYPIADCDGGLQSGAAHSMSASGEDLPCVPYASMPTAQLQTQLVATAFHHLTPLIPILCVADDRNIVPLLRSALSQKHALGHPLPIIGLRFPSSGPLTYQVLFAWRESSTSPEETRMQIGAPFLPGSGPCGVFDPDKPTEAYALMHFLKVVGVNATKVRSTWGPQLPVKPELFWRADGGMDLRQADRGVEVWRRHVLECSSNPSLETTTKMCLSNPSPPSLIWSSLPKEWILDETLFQNDDDTSDEDFEARMERIMMNEQEPKDAAIILTVAKWSADHHLLTLSLSPDGPVHQRHALMLDRYYKLMYPDERHGRPKTGLSPADSGSVAVPSDGPDDNLTLAGHPIMEVLTTLAREEVWQKPTYDSDRILRAWDDAMRWGVELVGSKPGLPVAFRYLPRTMVNHRRCAEYDAVEHSAHGFVPMPHDGMLDHAEAHLNLLCRERDAVNSQLDRPGLHAAELRAAYASAREANDACEHTYMIHAEIELFRDISQDTDSPRAKDWTPEQCAREEVAKLAARLQSYPVGGLVDTGISLAIDNLLDGLECDLNPVDAQVFLQDISCFVNPPVPQDATKPTLATPKDRPDPHHVLHLPVLLVNHQIHECGLDDCTRNKQRLNCASAVQFLATLGIKDFPVYGLATSGQYGYVCSAWYSTADNCTYIADRNVAPHAFDLETDGMDRFVRFLWGLREHAEELKARFDAIRGELVERMRTEAGRTSLRWTLRAQLDEYDLWPHEMPDGS